MVVIGTCRAKLIYKEFKSGLGSVKKHNVDNKK